MALGTEKIENSLAYKINAKKAKRTSHKLWKRELNRKQRRRIKADVGFAPEYKKNRGWEF